MGKSMQKRKTRISAFLLTLRHMLNNQPSQFITWCEEQTSFKIKNPSRFSEEVLPKYFKHSNLSSFIRQLNIYDFKKVANEKYPDEYIYEHHFFNKNRPQLMKNIHRKVNNLIHKIQKQNHNDENQDWIQYENSTTHEKKKLEDEIQLLQKKMEELKTTNTDICQQNLQMEGQIPAQKNQNSQISKILNQFLMQSYRDQYYKYAQTINNLLGEQSSLQNRLINDKKLNEQLSTTLLNVPSKQCFSGKSNQNTTNYNSNSEVGSINGKKSRLNQIISDGRSLKIQKYLDKNYQSQFKDEKQIKQKNRHLSTHRYQSGAQYQFPKDLEQKNLIIQGKNNKIFYQKDFSFSNQKEQSSKDSQVKQQREKEHNVCVIELKKRVNQVQNSNDDYFEKSMIQTAQNRKQFNKIKVYGTCW